MPDGPEQADRAPEAGPEEQSRDGPPDQNRPLDRSVLRSRAQRRRRPLDTVAIAVVLVAVLAIAALAFYASDRLGQLAGFGESEPEVEVAQPADAPPEPTAEALEPKIVDRLPQENEDGTLVAPDARPVQTTEVAPPPDADFPQAAPGEGTVVAEAPPPEEQEVAAPEPPDAAAPEVSTDVAPALSAAEASGPQRSILYEEPIPGSDGARVDGRATWSLVNEPVLPGEPPVPQIRAVVQVPDRNMTLTMSIRENSDDGLPASHVVEIRFDIPADFAGNSIETTPGLILKQTEDARGDALIGAVAEVSDNLFWLALSGTEREVTRNLSLLRERQWIDVPIRYGNRRRAILTFEKGAAGAKVVEEALQAWAD